MNNLNNRKIKKAKYLTHTHCSIGWPYDRNSTEYAIVSISLIKIIKRPFDKLPLPVPFCDVKFYGTIVRGCVLYHQGKYDD
jgi:hypothetical protein